MQEYGKKEQYLPCTEYGPGDFISGDWIRCADGPDLPLQVLYPVEDGLWLRHSFTWDEYGNPIRLDIKSKMDFMSVDLIQIDKEILEKIGFKCDDQYAFYDIDENTYLYYYFYEHRLDKIYHGIDEWENHAEVKDIMFRATVRTVDDLHHAFKMANVNMEIKL